MQFEDLEQYDYALPAELIRKMGVEPRDRARLFVYDTKTNEIFHDMFANITKYLPEQSLMVLNETRVVPARLWLKKETGGKVEVFVLANEWDGGMEIPVLVDRKCVIGQKLLFPNDDYFEVLHQEENKFFVRMESAMTLETLLDMHGETPVPHYLEEDEISRQSWRDKSGSGDEKIERERMLRKRYQTVFAASGASVAAPTASLHFTDRVFASLDGKHIDLAKVTLDVGLGTFAPLRAENFEMKQLHRERIDVSDSAATALNTAKQQERSIIAVGTTALRTLESICNNGLFVPYSGDTNIFIFPPHHFRSADILVTNFHLPKTSLMLLVDAFLEYKRAKRRIIPLYEEAIREKYSFYSFGDSMLIL